MKDPTLKELFLNATGFTVPADVHARDDFNGGTLHGAYLARC